MKIDMLDFLKYWMNLKLWMEIQNEEKTQNVEKKVSETLHTHCVKVSQKKFA